MDSLIWVLRQVPALATFLRETTLKQRVYCIFSVSLLTVSFLWGLFGMAMAVAMNSVHKLLLFDGVFVNASCLLVSVSIMGMVSVAVWIGWKLFVLIAKWILYALGTELGWIALKITVWLIWMYVVKPDNVTYTDFASKNVYPSVVKIYEVSTFSTFQKCVGEITDDIDVIRSRGFFCWWLPDHSPRCRTDHSDIYVVTATRAVDE